MLDYIHLRMEAFSCFDDWRRHQGSVLGIVSCKTMKRDARITSTGVSTDNTGITRHLAFSREPLHMEQYFELWLTTVTLASYPGRSLIKKTAWQLIRVQTVDFAALELAVPIRFQNASRDSCGISLRHKYITV